MWLRFELSAFLTSLRSVTLVLQKEAKKLTGFTEWYAKKQEEMRQDPLLRTVVELRNEVEKEGAPTPLADFSIVVRTHADGTVDGGVVFTGFSIEGRAFSLRECGGALERMMDLVVEAGKQGFLQAEAKGRKIPWRLLTLKEDADGKWRYADPGKPLGKHVEESLAEAMQGAGFVVAEREGR